MLDISRMFFILNYMDLPHLGITHVSDLSQKIFYLALVLSMNCTFATLAHACMPTCSQVFLMKEAGTSPIAFYLETNASVRIPRNRISSKEL